ncbi:hypothetical protein [Streptomyces synnematoformans]|uniref:Uncharacterized protein n=1 Tax=Streptomyces synnematoformans TaxID=415721 RepID=A0ABP5J0P6_9ACTN
MTDFADEARSRAARLLRMANTDDPREREALVAYAASTPDPPLMDAAGLATRGCTQCRRTMWQQRDVWVCSGCGGVEDDIMRCPACQVPMAPPAEGWFGRWSCPSCPRVAVRGDSATQIEWREQDRLHAIDLLDAAIAKRRGES